ncbi:MAG: hypothetical protein JXR31_10815 [Prolixibacteraceae bacterium]|nr:hypothetical protein [Prolixibacteraceae bacterium]
MKTFRIINLILPLIIIFSLISCDLSDNTTEFKVVPEVIILKKVINDTTKYAVAYYAYANKGIESAQVTPPGSSSAVELNTYEEAVITFAKVPDESDFSTVMPEFGQYNFNVQSKDGDIVEDFDVLTDIFLDTPVFSKIAFNSQNMSVRVEWSPVLNSDKYFVRLLNSDREMIYTGYEVDPDSTGYTMRTTDAGWDQVPLSGSNYTLQLNAVSYENNIDLTEYYYHVNAISIAENEITWNSN